MRILRFFLAFLITATTAAAQNTAVAKEPLTADAIMTRVAENQDRSEAQRKEFVYASTYTS